MRREIPRWRALANAGFVLAVLAVAGLGAPADFRRNWGWQPTFRLQAGFPRSAGSRSGPRSGSRGSTRASSRRSSPPVPGGRSSSGSGSTSGSGRWSGPTPRPGSSRPAWSGRRWSRSSPAGPTRPSSPTEGRSRVESPPELVDLMKQASASLRRVDAVAEAAEQGLGEVNAIAASIREGKGSLGKFVKDDEAYQKMMALGDHGSKAIDDLDQNLAALKRTWPLSRYFDDKGFYDRERVLFKPGSERDSRTLPADDLFEPGRSVLTAGGPEAARRRRRLVRQGEAAQVGGRHRRLHRRRPGPRPRPDPHPGAGRRRPEVPRRPPPDRLGRLVLAAARSPPSASARRPPGAPADPRRPARRVEVILFTPQA